MATEARIIITPTARLYFPTLLTPRAYHENGKPKGDPRFSTGLILEPAQMKEFKEWDEGTETFVSVTFSDVLIQVATKAWPEIEDIKASVKHGGIGWPIKKGDTIVAKKDGKHADSLGGRFLINPSSLEQYVPKLKARVEGELKVLNRGISGDEALIKNLFSGGNYAYAEINVKATEAAGKKYLTLYLNAVHFAKPGDAIGGGGGTIDRYAETQGGEADVDPTAPDTPDEDSEVPF